MQFLFYFYFLLLCYFQLNFLDILFIYLAVSQFIHCLKQAVVSFNWLPFTNEVFDLWLTGPFIAHSICLPYITV